MADLLEVDRLKVLKSFGKTEKEFQNDIEIIKTWLKSVPHLPDLQDERIGFILLISKFSLEKAKSRIDYFFTSKNYYKEFFTDLDPFNSWFDEIIQFNCWVPMKKYTPQLERVLIHSGLKYTNFIENVSERMVNSFKLTLAVMNIRSMVDFCTSDQIIVDLNLSNGNEMYKINPLLLKKEIDLIFVNGLSCRLKALHFINSKTPRVLEFLISLLKIVAKEKIVNRIHVHKSYDSLHKFIPKECLPNEFGGTGGEILNIHHKWIEEIKNYREFFLNDMKLKSDESKRLPDYQNPFDDSAHGSFRKLEVD